MAEGMFNTTANRYFERRMSLFGAMDYDEMLSAAERLLQENEQAREIARRYHAHVLVDEFQVQHRTAFYSTAFFCASFLQFSVRHLLPVWRLL